jgi:hypothetical protein
VIQLVSLRWSFYGVVAGTTVLAKQSNLFDQQTLRFPSHVMHVLRHNLLGELHLLVMSADQDTYNTCRWRGISEQYAAYSMWVLPLATRVSLLGLMSTELIMVAIKNPNRSQKLDIHSHLYCLLNNMGI